MDTVSILTIISAQDQAQRRAGDNGVTLRFTDEVCVPCANAHGEIMMPIPKMPMNKNEWIKYRAALIHEPLHIKRRDLFDIVEDWNLPPDHPLLRVVNVVEDSVMERLHLANYYGDRRDMAEALNVIHKELGEYLEKNKDKINPDDIDNARFFAINDISIKERARWHPESVVQGKLLEKYHTPESKKIVDRVINSGILDEWGAAVTTTDSAEVAKKLYNLIYDEENKAENDIKECQAKAKDKSNGCSASQDLARSDRELKDEARLNRGKIPWRFLNTSNHEKENGILGGGGGVDWTGKPLNYGGFRYIKPTLMIPKGSQNVYNYNETSNLGLANQIRRYIQSKQRVNIIPEKITGKLNTRALYRIAMPLRPNSDWNFRIFKKKDDVKKLNTAVSILVDWSGSMCSGNKKPLAVQAVTQCNKIFSDILHVPVEIAAFAYSKKPFHLIVKDFDKQITPVEIGQAFTYFDQFSSCNGDAHNVVCAAERLSLRKEKRKIILVMSDGQPSAGGDDPDAELRTVVKDLRNSGIDIYGIGMEDTSVTRYYGSNAKIVNNMSDISDVLLKTFQEDILEVCE